jgi:8-oxo-dGTP diphosphatase
MIGENQDAWTLFCFQSRSKTWGMVSLDGMYKLMSTTIEDLDGDWPQKVGKGLGVNEHLPLKGKVIVTSDIILLYNKKVLLIKRGKEPFKGLWAFPGGRIEETDEDIYACAMRELREETGITNVFLRHVKTIGNNKRDPRGFCLTNVFVSKLEDMPSNVKAGDDAVDFAWADINDLPNLAFDHKEILEDVLKNVYRPMTADKSALALLDDSPMTADRSVKALLDGNS